jgi:hypothetical protein
MYILLSFVELFLLFKFLFSHFNDRGLIIWNGYSYQHLTQKTICLRYTLGFDRAVLNIGTFLHISMNGGAVISPKHAFASHDITWPSLSREIHFSMPLLVEAQIW